MNEKIKKAADSTGIPVFIFKRALGIILEGQNEFKTPYDFKTAFIAEPSGTERKSGLLLGWAVLIEERLKETVLFEDLLKLWNQAPRKTLVRSKIFKRLLDVVSTSKELSLMKKCPDTRSTKMLFNEKAGVIAVQEIGKQSIFTEALELYNQFEGLGPEVRLTMRKVLITLAKQEEEFDSLFSLARNDYEFELDVRAKWSAKIIDDSQSTGLPGLKRLNYFSPFDETDIQKPILLEILNRF